MKKIILFLMILTSLAWGNYNSSTRGEYGSASAYFSSSMDSSWWIFSYPNEGNAYDTVSGYAWGDYQIADSISLDSLGSHFVKIYGFSGGVYADSIIGVWDVFAPPQSNQQYLVVLKVFDESDNGLSGTYLTVTNGTSEFYKSSDANGIDTFWLDAGTWSVYAYNTTYLQNSIPQTVDVSAAMTDTIEMTSQATGSGFVRLWAKAYDYQNGTSIEGATLTIKPNKYGWINTSTGGTYLPKRMTADTDSTGYASIIVPRTSSVTVSGSDSLKYDATFSYFEYFSLSDTNFVAMDSVSQAIVWDIIDD